MDEFIRYDKTRLTWFPKTPMAQAEETWLGPNQTAASFGGMPRMKICDAAVTVWPMNVM